MEALPFKVNEQDMSLLRTECSLLFTEEEKQPDLTDPTDLREFILRRQPRVQRIKDRQKSRQQKQSFRQNRAKYMRGIRRFHRNSKGKRFHRDLATFVATKAGLEDTQPKPLSGIKELHERASQKGAIIEFLSLKSHLNICNRYVVPGEAAQANWDLLCEYANKRLTDMIQCLEETEEKIHEDDIYMVLSLLNPGTLREVLNELERKGSPNFFGMCEEILGSLTDE